jgi:hypothetical protein
MYIEMKEISNNIVSLLLFYTHINANLQNLDTIYTPYIYIKLYVDISSF